MSKKPTRNNSRKYALQYEKNKKIAKLESEIINYKDLIKTGRIKNLKIYNKRIFKTIGSFVLSTLPFTLCFAVISGMVFLAGGGLPFIKDDIKKYNYVDGQMDSLGNCSIESEYLQIFDDSDDSEYCEVLVYTPWKKQDDQSYERTTYKYEFDPSDINMSNIQEYISKADYKSIDSLSEEKLISYEVTQNLNEDEMHADYLIMGNFYYKDGEDVIYVPESNSDNIFVSIIITIVSVGLEIAFYFGSDRELFDNVYYSIHYGENNIEDIKKLKLKLKKKKEELEQAKGGSLDDSKKR